ncbi:MAG: hypothetical protein WCG07_00965 [Candidatus Taylorbacteria bacterium]
MNTTWIFLIAFCAPMVYWRTLFYIAKHTFNTPFTRTKTGLQVHHLHYGALFTMIAVITMLLTHTQSPYIWALLGLGLGLIIDEYIPSLLLPGDRPVELGVYDKSFKPTVILFLGIVIVTVILYWVV